MSAAPCTGVYPYCQVDAKCEREDGHPGKHQDTAARWIWERGGGRTMTEGMHVCPVCGTRAVCSDLEKKRTEGDQCSSCDYWDAVVERVQEGSGIISEGVAYTWAPDKPWAFDGTRFRIIKTDGAVLGPGPGLWHNGTVPHERRGVLPDNATIEWGAA